MSVGIAKIQAESAARPSDPAFYRHLRGAETLGPLFFVFSGDGECEMGLTIAIVRRKNAAGKCHRLQGPAFAEQEQHLLAPNVERAEAVVGNHFLEAEKARVEVDRAFELIHVERSFKHAANAGHSCNPMVQSGRTLVRYSNPNERARSSIGRASDS